LPIAVNAFTRENVENSPPRSDSEFVHRIF
jgi:hypothetical protein